MGKLIVVEGACDGIGKSTQYNYLKEHLIKDGYVVDSHHFPSYNTYQGVPVEKYLMVNMVRLVSYRLILFMGCTLWIGLLRGRLC